MPNVSACSGADWALGRKLSRGGDVRGPGVGNFFEDCPSNPGTESISRHQPRAQPESKQAIHSKTKSVQASAISKHGFNSTRALTW